MFIEKSGVGVHFILDFARFQVKVKIREIESECEGGDEEGLFVVHVLVMPVVLLFIDHGSQGHEVVFISQCAAPDAFSAQGAVLDFASGKRDGPIVAVHHHGSIEDGAKSHGLDFPDLSYRRRSHGE